MVPSAYGYHCVKPMYVYRQKRDGETITSCRCGTIFAFGFKGCDYHCQLSCYLGITLVKTGIQIATVYLQIELKSKQPLPTFN